MTLSVPFVLASASPRRKHLMQLFGFPFTAEHSTVVEVIRPLEKPEDAVQRLAMDKAMEVANRHEQALVLGADTIVVVDDRILGKPADSNQAIEMLSLLSGRSHSVYTGIALVHSSSSRAVARFERTDVSMDDLSRVEIERYVASGSPMDKAGAYGIQDDTGALFIRGISGDYYTVVGLPMNRLYRLIQTDFDDLVQS